MKIIQVLPGFTTGGPSYTVPMMCRALKNSGAEVQLHFLDSIPQDIKDIDYVNYSFVKLPIVKLFGYSPAMRRGLMESCQSADIIQTNSLWQYPNYITEFARRGTKCKSVIVPRGTLSNYSLSLSKAKKRVVLALGQREALKNCDLFIATCWEEYKDIRNLGLKSPVAIIPNGIDIPVFERMPIKQKRVAFLSRIHKKKGLDYLINVWVKLALIYPEWKLSIAGPMNDYGEEMKQKAHSLGLDSVEFVGALYGNDKYNFLQDSELFVLPTHSENWGIAIPEALVCSIPAICTTGAPWKGLVTHDCGDWIELSEDNLFESLKSMMSYSPERRAEMGANGRKWVERDFSWNVIGEKTINAFNWLCGKTDVKPDYVFTE